MMKDGMELEVMLLVKGTLRLVLVLVLVSGLIALFNVNFMKL
jgi:hypothetical protein